MIGILFFNNISYCYANDLISQKIISNKDKNIITGSTQSINSLSKKVGNYLTIDSELKLDLDKNNQTHNTDQQFAQKPLILDTQSRLEIEENKKIEEQKKQTEQYNSYLAYNDYQRETITRESSTTRYIDSTQQFSNNYAYGYCTWYVASQRSVPNAWGNAGQWLGSAQTSGYSTGSTPQPNSIIVTSESGWGHVGIVTQVNNETIVISEMNYIGWGIVSSREIPLNSSIIKGYIY